MRAFIPIAMAMTVLFTGCVVPKTSPNANQLLGRWKTEMTQTEWGPSILEVTFHNAAELEFKITPRSGNQSMVSKGTYALQGQQLISPAINKGEPVAVWMEAEHLILQVPAEKPQRFRRQ